MASKRQTNLSILLTLNSKGFEKGLKAASKRLKSFGASMTSAGSTLTAGLTGPLAALSGVAGKTAVEFEFAMAKVQRKVWGPLLRRAQARLLHFS